MKKLVLLLSLISTSAFAQQPVTPFTPYGIDKDTHKQIMDYLYEQPTKFSLPLMNLLGGLAQKASEEAKKNDKKEDVK